ncbi:hypothetical protein [Streptomyces scabiei]|uniref:hypothetical protein n=1 Tax=Streptomyces scabiei TaxID=1930 RepID=UPI0027DEF63C|nr:MULTISPECIES: hypothetical protein [Streptomyces]
MSTLSLAPDPPDVTRPARATVPSRAAMPLVVALPLIIVPVGGQEPMTPAHSARVTLLVLYSPRLEECLRFYQGLGLSFAAERHGQGPAHHAAVLDDGVVFELYPARPGRQTDALRLGLRVDGTKSTPPLSSGRHLLTDPDGRTVDVHST